MGTGVEAFARLGEMIFLQSPGGARGPTRPTGGAADGGDGGEPERREEAIPELYVQQLIPSSLHWRAAGVRLTLEATAPGAAHPSAAFGMTVTIDSTAAGVPSAAAILLRLPTWARAPTLALNGAPLAPASLAAAAANAPAANGSWVRVVRRWA